MTTHNPLCCYTDCESDAAQSYSYVVVTSMDHENAGWTTKGAARVARILGRQGWTVEIRTPRRGEAEGTYYRRPDGTLQILGYSIPVPDRFYDALEVASEFALD